VVANFRETQLRHIAAGAPADASSTGETALSAPRGMDREIK